MRKISGWVGVGILFIGVAAATAQTTNTFPASGSVGIGTTSPIAPLDVTATVTNQNPSGGHYLLNYALGGDVEDPNSGDIILLIPASTGSPAAGSQFEGVIESNRGSGGSWNLNSEWYVSTQSAYTNNTGSILPLSGQQEYAATPILITCVYEGITYIGFQTPSGNSSSLWSLTGNWSNGQNSQKPILVAASSVSNISTLVGYESVGSQISIADAGNTGMGEVTNGNVGIGTTTPTSKLEVDGSITLTYGQGGYIKFADGSTQATAYKGVACGGDYAESVDVDGDPHHYVPGDVLVISDDTTSDVEKSQKPYSTEVVGVYSTKPGYVGRRFKGPKSKQEVPMAMIGIVPVKVTAVNGAIHRGDLLVTSSIPGYAMKGTDRSKMLGAVVGKALGHLASGRGVIEAVITLQ